MAGPPVPAKLNPRQAEALAFHKEAPAMTYIEPEQAPEIDPTPANTPEVDPGATPAEMPPLEPGGGEDGDSRPYQ